MKFLSGPQEQKLSQAEAGNTCWNEPHRHYAEISTMTFKSEFAQKATLIAEIVKAQDHLLARALKLLFEKKGCEYGLNLLPNGFV